MGIFKSVAGFLEDRFSLSDKEGMEVILGKLEDKFATKVLAFYLGVSYIADTIAKCEVKRFVDGKPTKDSFYYLLNISPNQNENASQLKAKLIHKLFYNNEALMFEYGGNFYVADSFVKEESPLKGDKFTNITLTNEPTKTFTRKASDVFYFKLDEKKLKSLVDDMLNDFSEILKYAMGTYKISNSEKWKLVLDEVRAGDKQFKEDFENVIKKQLESFINNPKAVYPQFKGQSLEKILSGDGKTDSSDIKNINTEIFERTAIALKMPVSMLYGNMTNAKDIINSFVTFRIDPLAKMISEELTRKTSTMDDFVKGTYMDVDTTMIMHVDIFDSAPNIDKLIASGTYNQDEVRVKLGDHALNTDFSKQYWITKNYSRIEDALNGEGDIVEGGE